MKSILALSLILFSTLTFADDYSDSSPASQPPESLPLISFEHTFNRMDVETMQASLALVLSQPTARPVAFNIQLLDGGIPYNPTAKLGSDYIGLNGTYSRDIFVVIPPGDIRLQLAPILGRIRFAGAPGCDSVFTVRITAQSLLNARVYQSDAYVMIPCLEKPTQPQPIK